MNTNMIGHNQPPEPETGWKKKFFHMPIEEAEIIVALLEQFKATIPKNRTDIRDIIDDRLFFINRKMP